MNTINKVPTRLFKYHSISSNTIKVIETGDVWFSERGALNDPLDCHPEYAIDTLSDEDLDEVFSIVGTPINPTATRKQKIDLIKQSHESLLSECGVYCVTDSATNELMWAHYGDEHRGISLEWEIDETKINDPRRSWLTPHPVDYIGRGLINGEDYLEYLKNGLVPPDAYMRMMKSSYFQKTARWKYENEYRFLALRKKGSISIEAALKSVTFGMRATKDTIARVDSILPTTVSRNTVSFLDDKLVLKNLT